MHEWQLTEQSKINELCEVVKLFHDRGLSPGTSTNYSFRLQKKELIGISQSRIDKSKFSISSLMVIDEKGVQHGNTFLKPSDETDIHLVFYKDASVGAVFHTHSIASAILSMKSKNNFLEWEGLEMLKGLEGNKTHEMKEILPIFENSQDIKSLATQIESYWKLNPHIHGVILKGHGLYTWGKDIATVKRHVEVFEYLLEYKLKAGEY